MNVTRPIPLENEPIEIDVQDCPVYCPSPKMSLWNMHPRVFLEFTHGEAYCAYCGARYRLRAEDPHSA
jgi:uncharacterized Zn-finger protein